MPGDTVRKEAWLPGVVSGAGQGSGGGVGNSGARRRGRGDAVWILRNRGGPVFSRVTTRPVAWSLPDRNERGGEVHGRYE